jgi:hypothetical protein
VVDECAEVCRSYGARVVTDQFSSAAVVERLRQRHGLAVESHSMSASSKTAIFGELRTRLYDGSLRLPDDPRLTAELRRLRTRYTAGSATVVNPRVGGSHGDRAQALALAVFELRQRAKPRRWGLLAGRDEPADEDGFLLPRSKWPASERERREREAPPDPYSDPGLWVFR